MIRTEDAVNRNVRESQSLAGFLACTNNCAEVLGTDGSLRRAACRRLAQADGHVAVGVAVREANNHFGSSTQANEDHAHARHPLNMYLDFGSHKRHLELLLDPNRQAAGLSHAVPAPAAGYGPVSS
jgi:hypothetical protein